MNTHAVVVLVRVVLAVLLLSGIRTASVLSEEAPVEEKDNPADVSQPFDPRFTYDVVFSLHPRELDRLSAVRILGITQLGRKTFLRFEVLLNNQKQEGVIGLQTISAIFPTGKALVATSELLLERERLNEEKVKEVRSETVREIIRELPPSIHSTAR